MISIGRCRVSAEKDVKEQERRETAKALGAVKISRRDRVSEISVK